MPYSTPYIEAIMAKDRREILKGIRFGTGAEEGDYFNEDSDPDELIERIEEETEAEGYDGPDKDEILRNLTITGSIAGFVDDEDLDLDSPDADIRASARHRAAEAAVQDAEKKKPRTRRGRAADKKKAAKKTAPEASDSSDAAE